jgi:hypothetical protein
MSDKFQFVVLVNKDLSEYHANSLEYQTTN